MRYASPHFEGTEQFVPVVFKNRDALVGFLQGASDYYESMYSILEELEMDDILFPPGMTEMLSVSSRKYNDIMPDGRRESSLTKKERKKLLEGLFSELEGVDESVENEDVEYSDVLRVSCHCGMGFYSWKNLEDIPSVDVRCDICGRHLIHYTGVDDWELDYEEGEPK